MRQEECCIKGTASVGEVDVAYDRLISDLGANGIPWGVLCFTLPNEADELRPTIPALPVEEENGGEDFEVLPAQEENGSEGFEELESFDEFDNEELELMGLGGDSNWFGF